MGKRSFRRSVRYEKDHTGCMGGLISIFDFRHGRSTQKLLSDRRHGSRHSVGSGYSRTKVNMLKISEQKDQNIEDGEGSKTAAADAIKTSVKELMEEEMFKEEEGSNKVELKQFDLEYGGHGKRSHKQINKTGKKSHDMQICNFGATTNLGHETTCHQVMDEHTSIDIDLEVIMEELCHQIHQKSTSSVEHDWHNDLDMQSNHAYSVFHEKLITATKVIIDQRFTKEKYPTEDEKTHHSKEFMDALNMLSSNKELFSKLLEDPKSSLVKCIQDLENARLSGDQRFDSLAGSDMLDEKLSNPRRDGLVNRKHHYFFRRKSKSQENIPMKGNEAFQPSSRIVILKPGLTGLRNSDITSLQSHSTKENRVPGERNTSQFSFTEIKRKLKHAMGKERHRISRDVTTHRFPYEHQNLGNGEKGVGGAIGGWSSPNRNHFYTENFAKLSNGVKRRDNIGKSRGSETSMVSETTGYGRQGVSNIYIEAKKHLSEILSNEEENSELMTRQSPKTLGRVLSLPEYNFSPGSSPGKDSEHGFVTAKMRLGPCSNFQMVNENTWKLVQENHAVHLRPPWQNFESQSGIADDNPDEKSSLPNSIPACEIDRHNSEEETMSSTRDGISSEGVAEILKTIDTGYQEDSKVLDVLHEPISSLVIRDAQNCDTAEVSDEERSSQCFKLDSFEEDLILSSPSVSPSWTSVTTKIEGLESAVERAERPSPISVLEPLYIEDDIKPESTTVQSVESAIQPLQINFEERVYSATEQGICTITFMKDEESAFEYVEAVLLGSGLNWDDFICRLLSSEEVLDPSLFDEVELFSNRSSHDQKLLFDCTNEVLKEICEHYFGCFPRVSYVKQNVRPVPIRMSLIHEVWKGVEWHLIQQSPHSLDQLVQKDFVKPRTWMDLKFETKHIGVEIGEYVLEELMDDTVFSVVNGSPEKEFPRVLDGFNESGSNANL